LQCSGRLLSGGYCAYGARFVATNFGKYRLVRRLAVGGMAEVFLGVARGEGGFTKHVAIKRILPHLTEEREFISMFFDEARILASFNHPNIVQIFDLGRVKNTYFLAMEFVHGMTMFGILNLCMKKKRRLPIDIAAKIISTVADALDYAHNFTKPDGTNLGIVHRDVSAQNVMLSVDGVVKVLDFGIAKAVGNLSRTRPTWLKGKAMYMSPEQIEMRDSVDRRSDIFSLGTLLYVFATQKRPFRGDSEYQVMMSIVNDEACDPRDHDPDIPAELAMIMNRALKKDRTERYQTARKMREELERFLFNRQALVDNHVLARFLQNLAPRKKKTGRTRRVPTRPIEAPVEELGSGRLRAPAGAGPDNPLVLEAKKKSGPILLEPKGGRSPIREVPPPEGAEPVTSRPSLEIVAEEPVSQAKTSSFEPSEPPAEQAMPVIEDVEPVDQKAQPPVEKRKMPQPEATGDSGPVVFGPPDAPVAETQRPGPDEIPVPVPKSEPVLSAAARPGRSPVPYVIVFLLLIGGGLGLYLYLSGAFSRTQDAPETPEDEEEAVETGTGSETAAGGDRAADGAKTVKDQRLPVVQKPEKAPGYDRRPRRQRRRRRSQIDFSAAAVSEPVIEQVPADDGGEGASGKDEDATRDGGLVAKTGPGPDVGKSPAARPDAGTAAGSKHGEGEGKSPKRTPRSPPLEEPPEIDGAAYRGAAGVDKPGKVKDEPGKDVAHLGGGKRPGQDDGEDNVVTRVKTKPVYQRSAALRKRRVSGVDPAYPRIARQARIEATLVVKITLGPAGRVKDYRFLKTHEAFEKSVIEALKTWKFSPHLVNGKPVSTYTVYKFVFKLD